MNIPRFGERTRDWIRGVTIGIVGAIVSVAATAVLAWLLSAPKPDPLTVGFEMRRSALAPDETTREVVKKGVSLRIGDRELPAIYTHTIRIKPHSGAAEEVNVRIGFQPGTEIFDKSFTPPSELHDISIAKEFPGGYVFTLKKFEDRGFFTVVLVSSSPQRPELDPVGIGVHKADLDTVDAYERHQKLRRLAPFAGTTFLVVLVSTVWLWRRRIRRRASQRLS